MEKRRVQLLLVRLKKLVEAFFGVRREKVYPRRGDGLVIQIAEAVVRGERLNSSAHVRQCIFERFLMQMEPSQPQMVGMTKFGCFQVTGVKCFEEFVITQMGGGRHERHRYNYDRISVFR